jgi:hypothetical protein
LTVRQVLDEAYRVPGGCPHVLSPAFRVLHGPASPGPILDGCELVWAAARDGGGRRLQRTVPVLLSAVASHPDRIADADPEVRERIERWHRRVLECWQGWWGERLVAVLEHLDEARFHLHALVIPPVRQGRLMMGEIFPAHAARAVARETGQPRRLVDRAYKQGLRAIQDLFWSEVSAREGHARVGPRRQRLSRAGWKARRAEQERLGEMARRLEREDADLRRLDIAAAAAEAARRRAEDAEERARRAEAEAAAGREALALLARARAAADEIERMGGWRASRTAAEREARVLDRLRALSRAS